jgi:hypothetical protein
VAVKNRAGSCGCCGCLSNREANEVSNWTAINGGTVTASGDYVAISGEAEPSSQMTTESYILNFEAEGSGKVIVDGIEIEFDVPNRTITAGLQTKSYGGPSPAATTSARFLVRITPTHCWIAQDGVSYDDFYEGIRIVYSNLAVTSDAPTDEASSTYKVEGVSGFIIRDWTQIDTKYIPGAGGTYGVGEQCNPDPTTLNCSHDFIGSVDLLDAGEDTFEAVRYEPTNFTLAWSGTESDAQTDFDFIAPISPAGSTLPSIGTGCVNLVGLGGGDGSSQPSGTPFKTFYQGVVTKTWSGVDIGRSINKTYVVGGGWPDEQRGGFEPWSSWVGCKELGQGWALYDVAEDYWVLDWESCGTTGKGEYQGVASSGTINWIECKKHCFDCDAYWFHIILWATDNSDPYPEPELRGDFSEQNITSVFNPVYDYNPTALARLATSAGFSGNFANY